MRKFLTLIISFVLISLFVSPAANSASVVVITEPTHRLSNGVFLDDELATKLNPAGELGSLIYAPSRGVRSWLIDPATLSEIVAMSNGYVISDGWEIKDAQVSGQEIAKQWLAQFKKVTRFEKVAAITYGSPSLTWINKLIPNQLPYLNAVSKLELESFLGRVSEPVVSQLMVTKKLVHLR